MEWRRLTMYVTFKNKAKSVNLYNDNGQIIRRVTAKGGVINAIINGAGKDATIAITTVDGKTVLYKSTGQMIRTSK